LSVRIETQRPTHRVLKLPSGTRLGYSGVMKIFNFVAIMMVLALQSPIGIRAATEESLPSIGPATEAQKKTLEKFQRRLSGAGQVRAKLNRKTTVGLLGTEKKATGDLLVSKGRVRMDLKTADTNERQLLVVGDKAFWAVTYPPSEMKDAAVQVVTGPVKSKKSGPTGFLALLGKDGFLKSFTVSGVALDKDGGIRYYLQPKADWVEAKRALLALGPEVTGTKGERDFREILIWDFQDNETQYTLGSVKFESGKAPNGKFEFSPPKNADVMSVAN
jgi:outer membrane lipoprotein-sorting protein